jgi:hypothetical protein
MLLPKGRGRHTIATTTLITPFHCYTRYLGPHPMWAKGLGCQHYSSQVYQRSLAHLGCRHAAAAVAAVALAAAAAAAGCCGHQTLSPLGWPTRCLVHPPSRAADCIAAGYAAAAAAFAAAAAAAACCVVLVADRLLLRCRLLCQSLLAAAGCW